MENNFNAKPSKWFWAFSVLALLWNLMGVSAYLMGAYLKDEMMIGFSDAQKAIINALPSWTVGAYAIAVFAGAIGCIALLMRKKWAYPVLLISLLAVILRTGYIFFMTEATSAFDVVQGTVLPIAVLIIAGLLVVFAKVSIDRNWIQ